MFGEIKSLYKIIGLPNTLLVLVKDGRNILYLDKLEQVFQNREAYSHFINIGHIYLGMGHIIGIGYSKIALTCKSNSDKPLELTEEVSEEPKEENQ